MTGTRIARHISAISRRTYGALSRRVQAALLSTVLAISAMVPAGIAGATDAERQAAGPPGQGASESDPAGGTDFDPGGATTSLGQEVGAPDQPASSDHAAAPIEPEPARDADPAPERAASAPTPTGTETEAAATDAPAGQEQATASAPSTSDVSPAPVPSAVAPIAAPSAPTLPSVPATGAQSPKLGADLNLVPEVIRKQRDQAQAKPSRGVIPAAQLDLPARSTVITAAVEPSAASTPAPNRVGTRRAGNVRWHTVAQGECLWTIAADLLDLPQDSSAENNARIQTEVDRLWRLNADRIGTGDPDEIEAGTRIRLY